MKPYFSRIVDTGFGETIQKVTEVLKEFGFGIITEIDVAETFKKKIDKDFRPYRILGACNPHFAYNALNTDDKAGILLPCNIIVQQLDDGKVEIIAVNPESAVKEMHNPELDDFACEVTGALRKFISRF